jgi:Family of unknown function (DUF6272)
MLPTSTNIFAQVDLRRLADNLEPDHQVLFVMGEIDHPGVAGIINTLEGIMRKQGYRQGMRSRAKLICVEVLENLVKHGKTEAKICPFFRILFASETLNIEAGNALTSQNYQLLSLRTDALRKMSLTEISEDYAKQLNDGKFYGEGNAGLGLLSIAKRSGHNEVYTYEQLDQDEYYCRISITVHETLK